MGRRVSWDHEVASGIRRCSSFENTGECPGNCKRPPAASGSREDAEAEAKGGFPGSLGVGGLEKGRPGIKSRN